MAKKKIISTSDSGHDGLIDLAKVVALAERHEPLKAYLDDMREHREAHGIPTEEHIQRIFAASIKYRLAYASPEQIYDILEHQTLAPAKTVTEAFDIVRGNGELLQLGMAVANRWPTFTAEFFKAQSKDNKYRRLGVGFSRDTEGEVVSSDPPVKASLTEILGGLPSDEEVLELLQRDPVIKRLKETILNYKKFGSAEDVEAYFLDSVHWFRIQMEAKHHPSPEVIRSREQLCREALEGNKESLRELVHSVADRIVEGWRGSLNLPPEEIWQSPSEIAAEKAKISGAIDTTGEEVKVKGSRQGLKLPFRT